MQLIIFGILILTVLPDYAVSIIIDSTVVETVTPSTSCLCNTYNTTSQTYSSCSPSSSSSPSSVTNTNTALEHYDEVTNIPLWWKRKVWQASDLTLVAQGRTYAKNIKGGYTPKALVVIAPFSFSFTAPILSHLVGLLGRKGWSLTIIHTGNNEESIRTAVRGWNVVHFRHSGYMNKLSGKTSVPSDNNNNGVFLEKNMKDDDGTNEFTDEYTLVPTEDAFTFGRINEESDEYILHNQTLQHQDYINLISSFSFWEALPGSPQNVFVVDSFTFLRTAMIDKFLENSPLLSPYFYYHDTVPVHQHPHILLANRTIMLQVTKAWELLHKKKPAADANQPTPSPTPTYPPRLLVHPSTDEQKFWNFVQSFEVQEKSGAKTPIPIGSSSLHHEFFGLPPNPSSSQQENSSSSSSSGKPPSTGEASSSMIYNNATYPIVIDRTHIRTTDPTFISSLMNILDYYQDKRYIVPEKPIKTG